MDRDNRGQQRQQQQRHQRRRNNLAREDLLERAIFIPLRSRIGGSLNLPHGSSSSPSLHYPEAHARMIRSLMGNTIGGGVINNNGGSENGPGGAGDGVGNNNNTAENNGSGAGANINIGRNRELENMLSRRARMNVSTVFMELTYSTADHHHHHHHHHFHNHIHQFTKSSSLSPVSAEALKRRMEIHAVNTMALIKRYCPSKLHKLSQYRYCSRAQKQDFFAFKQYQSNPLQMLEPCQVKCNTKVIVIVKDGNLAGDGGSGSSGKILSTFTPYLLTYLSKKHLNPTCLTFQSDSLNLLIKQLYTDLHVFSDKVNLYDVAFTKEAKSFILYSTLAKLIENWKVPLLILDSPLWKTIEIEKVLEFGKKFGIKTLEVDPTFNSPSPPPDGLPSHAAEIKKATRKEAKRVGRQVVKAVREINFVVGKKELEKNLSKYLEQGEGENETNGNNINEEAATISSSNKNDNCNNSAARLMNDDCQKIVMNLQERMSQEYLHEQDQRINAASSGTNTLPNDNGEMDPVINAASQTQFQQLSLLEDEILADIENSVAFRYSPSVAAAASIQRQSSALDTAGYMQSESRPRTGYSSSFSDEEATFRDTEKVSELLFTELNQRWRVHGPQRYIPSKSTGAADGGSGPYCEPLQESERQLIFSVAQEVANFEMLKDIRNVLKDSKKDLEGRLYGYNPDFSNLIASAEEFLHGKGSCMEPSQEEMEFYKMPVSMVYSEAEVKYIKAKPPVYVMGSESPSHFIKMALEESSKLFWNSILHTTCGSRHVPFSMRNKTKAIVVVEDNNEVLELLTAALWFFEKTPLATFQSKFCGNHKDFHLTIDACRVFFGNFPVHNVKKEDDHIFERWLGVGLNGILRSFQSKIVLIDFPRPAMGLKKSRDILYNRLKIEEKLHNIKSFTVNKSSRKDDNLSTVENVLDEIQRCLAPRDQLLFRKARRMYLDLKLYKQIEQKSRHDLKILRDWGLPEPENELGLWERLRTSEFVTNPSLPAPIPAIDSALIEEEPIPTVTAVSSEEEGRPSIDSEEDFSDSTSTTTLSPEQSESTSKKESFQRIQQLEEEDSETECQDIARPRSSAALLECRQQPQVEEEDQRSWLDEVEAHDKDYSNFKNSNPETLTETTSTAVEERNPPEHGSEPILENRGYMRPVGMENAYNLVQLLFSPGQAMDSQALTDHSETVEFLDISELPSMESNTKQNLEEEEKISEAANAESVKETDGHKSELDDESTALALKRSAGLVNIFHEIGAGDSDKSRFACGDGNQVCFIEKSPSDLDFGQYDHLEFALPPKPIHTIMSCSSIEFEELLPPPKRTVPIPIIVLSESDSENYKQENSLRSMIRKRSFQEVCTAHLGKLGKSLSRIIQRRKPRKISPYCIPSSLPNNEYHGGNAEIGSSFISSNTSMEGCVSSCNVTETDKVESVASPAPTLDRKNSKTSVLANSDTAGTVKVRQNSNKNSSSWISSFVRYVRGKVQRKKYASKQ